MTRTEKQALLTALAKNHLDIDTLERRKSDSLDFHEVSVWNLEAVLDAAFKAGRASGLKDGKRSAKKASFKKDIKRAQGL